MRLISNACIMQDNQEVTNFSTDRLSFMPLEPGGNEEELDHSVASFVIQVRMTLGCGLEILELSCIFQVELNLGHGIGILKRSGRRPTPVNLSWIRDGSEDAAAPLEHQETIVANLITKSPLLLFPVARDVFL
jgi:hypothetical protein